MTKIGKKTTVNREIREMMALIFVSWLHLRFVCPKAYRIPRGLQH